MDFDHVRGEKELPIANALAHNVDLKLIAKEIEKCEVVCANCHRIRTWGKAYAKGQE